MSKPRWTGAKDTGGRMYTPAEYVAVGSVLAQCIGRANAKTVEQMATITKIGSRTVRSALSAYDGTPMGVQAYTESGAIYLAEWAEDAEGYTSKLKGQVRTMLSRIDRREEGTKLLPRRQSRLF
jgi:hypothetical protein